MNDNEYRYKKLQLKFETGDITQAYAEGLMTLVNSGRMWFGGVDSAIQKVAGHAYHQTAMRQLDQLGRDPPSGRDSLRGWRHVPTLWQLPLCGLRDRRSEGSPVPTGPRWPG